MTSIKFCEEELDICNNTTIDYSMNMREACEHELLQHKGRIGGNNYTVEIEIDEALFTKRKNHVGRVCCLNNEFLGVSVVIGSFQKKYCIKLFRETREAFMVAVTD